MSAEKEYILEGFSPAEPLKYFEEICRIPHGSGNTKMISDYLVAFAKEHNLFYVQDENNNVIIKKQGTAGYENSSTVIIQGHMDMVCQKTEDCKIDFEKDGLELYLDVDEKGRFIAAKGTTLGGDDGIAVAYALAILASEDIPHPPIEVVITVDEEIGMLGAAALDCSDLKGRIMLNADSEVEGHLLVSCAGGATVACHLPVDFENLNDGVLTVIEVKGATGGHSGMEIIKQGANADKLLARILYKLSKVCDYRLNTLAGGDKDNAIPQTATASIYILNEDDFGKAEETIANIMKTLNAEYVNTDPNLEIKLKKAVKVGCKCMTKDSTEKTVAMLVTLPNGVQRMSSDVKDLVQTSLNLGILKTNATLGDVCSSFSVRSSVDSEKQELIDRLECVMCSLGGNIEISGEYPAWEYNRESKLRMLMLNIYEKMYGHKAIVEAIHAGVECGIFAGKLPGLDCVSYGPDMTDIHTVNEKLYLESADRTWKYTLEILKQIKDM